MVYLKQKKQNKQNHTLVCGQRSDFNLTYIPRIHASEVM